MRGFVSIASHRSSSRAWVSVGSLRRKHLRVICCIECTTRRTINMRSKIQGQVPYASAGDPGPRSDSTETKTEDDLDGTQAEKSSREDSIPVRTALAMLQFYKSAISPLLPSSCRFLPTCSEYSMLSYKQYGVWRGTVLTGWRLLRCNPWGDRGYDPPQWPPKGLEPIYGNFEYAPHLTVMIGSALMVYIIEDLLHELGFS